MTRAGAPLLDLADLSPTEDGAKARAAASRYVLRAAASDADFALGYGVLADAFGPTGEIEREETLRAWFTRGSLSAPDAPIGARYHLVLAFDADGALAGVRDGF
ncbi:MAG: hypothetical protein ACK4YP_18455, partial [Myxococcota bacterium]